MKRIHYIASAIVILALASCEKDEFEGLVQESAQEPVMSQSTSSKLDNDNGSASGVTTDDFNSVGTKNVSSLKEVSQSKDGDIDEDTGNDLVSATIKEVSDGDDEADGGDDSQIAE